MMLMSTRNRNRGTGTRAVSCCDFDDEAKAPRRRKFYRRKAKRAERQSWKKEALVP